MDGRTPAPSQAGAAAVHSLTAALPSPPPLDRCSPLCLCTTPATSCPSTSTPTARRPATCMERTTVGARGGAEHKGVLDTGLEWQQQDAEGPGDMCEKSNGGSQAAPRQRRACITTGVRARVVPAERCRGAPPTPSAPSPWLLLSRHGPPGEGHMHIWRNHLLAGCVDKNSFGKHGLLHVIYVRGCTLRHVCSFTTSSLPAQPPWSCCALHVRSLATRVCARPAARHV